MFNWIRVKMGPIVVTLIAGGIALVFILSDVFSSRLGGGGQAGGEAGSVNGESISRAEFNRELARRVESLKQMTGGKLTDEQLKMFRIRETVFNELVQRKLVLQEARDSGVLPTDEEVRDRIQELPYFQKDGKFDLATYRNVLSANSLQPGRFEEMIRDELLLQSWSERMRSRIRVSDDEVRREFLVAEDQRRIRYVSLDLEAGRKAVRIPDSDIESFLKDAGKLERAKSRYEQQRGTTFKNRKFEAVQRQIAREILAGERVDEARKANQKLADQLVSVMGPGSDARVKALLKPVGAELRTSDWVTLETPNLPGLGEVRPILEQAFAGKLGKPAKFETAAAVVVAVVTDSRRPDLKKLAGESAKIEQKVRFRKERELEEQWLRELREKARVRMDEDFVNEGASDVG